MKESADKPLQGPPAYGKMPQTISEEVVATMFMILGIGLSMLPILFRLALEKLRLGIPYSTQS